MRCCARHARAGIRPMAKRSEKRSPNFDHVVWRCRAHANAASVLVLHRRGPGVSAPGRSRACARAAALRLLELDGSRHVLSLDVAGRRRGWSRSTIEFGSNLRKAALDGRRAGGRYGLIGEGWGQPGPHRQVFHSSLPFAAHRALAQVNPEPDCAPKKGHRIVAGPFWCAAR